DHTGRAGVWLRWWDRSGNLLLWGDELADQERQRAEQEKQRAEQEKQRAEQEKQRAEQEQQRAEQEKQRAERLLAQLRAAGIEPEED
ncbi:MAG: Uma2 family endonuclease, partial [Cyanophyceae cyanobacterium]